MSNDLKQLGRTVLAAVVVVVLLLAAYAAVKSLNSERAANASCADSYSRGMPGTDRGC